MSTRTDTLCPDTTLFRSTSADTVLTTGDGEQAVGYFQNSEINEDILLPPARPQDDDPDRTWSRDYIGVAVGVISVPRYNGADDNTIMPGFHVRGRVSGHSFLTRGTNLQVNQIRQRLGQGPERQHGPHVTMGNGGSGRDQ